MEPLFQLLLSRFRRHEVFDGGTVPKGARASRVHDQVEWAPLFDVGELERRRAHVQDAIVRQRQIRVTKANGKDAFGREEVIRREFGIGDDCRDADRADSGGVCQATIVEGSIEEQRLQEVRFE